MSFRSLSHGLFHKESTISAPIKVKKLKFNTSQFLVAKCRALLTSSAKARKLQTASHQPKDTTKRILLSLFGETEVTNRVLPLAFSSPENPAPERYAPV